MASTERSGSRNSIQCIISQIEGGISSKNHHCCLYYATCIKRTDDDGDDVDGTEKFIIQLLRMGPPMHILKSVTGI